MQPYGKILVAGITWAADSTNSDFALARYNDDGSLDTDGFGIDGVVVTDLGNFSYVNGATLQPDGKILVVGYVDDGVTNDFFLVRYNDDGSLDTDFGSDGVVITDLGGRDIARSVTVQPDGKILVAGDTATESGDFASDFALVRYNDNGTLDTDFGTGGIVITDLGYDEGSASVTVANDKILLAGSSLMARNMTLFWCVTTSMMDHWIPALAHRHPLIPSSSISGLRASICPIRPPSTSTPTASLTISPGPTARMACW